MSSHRIEKILEKYFQGESSLTEERTLREYFRKEDVPPHLAELKEQFLVIDEERKQELPEDFDDLLFENIEKEQRSKKASKRAFIYYVSSVAATILILVTVFFSFNPFASNTSYNEQEADLAFTEASRILYFVSEKFNKGANPLGKMARFDEGVRNLSSMKKFDDGVEKASPISRFNQITNLITNPAP